MKLNSRNTILWSLALALAMVATTFLFKSTFRANPATFWIVLSLYLAVFPFIHSRRPRPSCAR